MRLKQFLNESQTIPIASLKDRQKFINLVEDIKSKCGPYFAKQTVPLFRGSTPKDTIVIDKVRKDRQPLDDPIIFHDLLGKITKEETGVNLRTETLFCITSPTAAAAYGTPHLILPIGDCKIFYGIRNGSKIEDLYNSIGYFLNSFTKTGQITDKHLSFYFEPIKNVIKKSKMVEVEYLDAYLNLITRGVVNGIQYRIFGDSEFKSARGTEDKAKEIIKKMLNVAPTFSAAKTVELKNVEFTDKDVDNIYNGLIKSVSLFIKDINWKTDDDFENMKNIELLVDCDEYYKINVADSRNEIVSKLVAELPFSKKALEYVYREGMIDKPKEEK
jgi:hypothetical protein